MFEPTVVVRDLETNAVYKVTEARYRRTPELWERLGSEPKKPKITVARAAARNKSTSQDSTTSATVVPDEKADEPATEQEN